MNITQANYTFMPKDTPNEGIPTLPCDNQEENAPIMMPLAMVTIKKQCFKGLYEPEQGFQAGTIFQEFDLPFYGTGGALL
ncbi:spore coat associated protein CotJA [Anaerocolumna xylanovorans]|uniref:Spore coat associated protein JA (CotJA) n=1 Tax=Anaerocolumna xylanovorans DSM 12503 TaxID=1121345 RepID=A0A1M7YKE5_9FIRM|nr:spore coat associated protein CotJA [Anaerocolumna xylanovorans]SHO53067.1 Spore coat associated protein JA (CotJA) [Anaerocolumna xylanovorans DSM 12503]